MPLPLLLIPLAIAGGSAVAQTVAKLRAHGRLSALRAELEELEAHYREELRQHYDQQAALYRELGWGELAPPAALDERRQPEADAQGRPWWRRLLRRRRRGLLEGPAQSRTSIIGRHGASFAAGTVWRTSSAAIMNVVRPVMNWLLTLLPRFAAVGGGGSSIVAATGVRFAVGAFTAFGIVLGPILAAVAIFREIRRVRKAQWELVTARLQRQAELDRCAVRTRQLQWQLSVVTRPPGAVPS